MSNAWALAPVLPGATASGFASACFVSPCPTTSGANASTIGSTTLVPLSTFGETGSYYVNARYPNQTFASTFPNTPGVVTADIPGTIDTGSVTINRVNPAIDVEIDRNSPSGGAEGDSGTVDYWFEVVDSANPAVRSPVTLGVTAAGGFTGVVSALVVNPSYYGDDARATASILITPGPGTTTLSTVEHTNFDYLNDGGTVYITDPASENSANLALSIGPTSTFSGAFSLRKAPIQVETNTPYEVQLAASINGGANLDGSVFIDPTISAPTGYQLYFSQGVANGVPESSAWLLMLVGFAGLGGALRSFRARPSTTV